MDASGEYRIIASGRTRARPGPGRAIRQIPLLQDSLQDQARRSAARRVVLGCFRPLSEGVISPATDRLRGTALVMLLHVSGRRRERRIGAPGANGNKGCVLVNVRGNGDGPYRCPCCGYMTPSGRGGYEICPVCFWEDDGQDDHDADRARGGPNRDLSLTQARRNFERMGASDERRMKLVRDPTPEEHPLA